MLDSNRVDAISNVMYINKSLYGYSTFVIKQDGTVYAAGLNTSGQLGLEKLEDEYAVREVEQWFLSVKDKPFSIKEGKTKPLDVELTTKFNVLNKDNVQLNLTYESTDTNVFTVDANGIVTGKKAGSAKVKVMDSTTGLKTMAEITVLQDVEDAITKPMIGLGENFSAVLKQDGTVWTVGYNVYGQLRRRKHSR